MEKLQLNLIVQANRIYNLGSSAQPCSPSRPQPYAEATAIFLDEFDACRLNRGRIFSAVPSRPPSSPSIDSSLAMVGSDTADRSAKTACDHPRTALTAFKLQTLSWASS
jgi:hypothetical protein